MNKYHYLGFKRFAGRSLRYLITWRGHWIALAGWQTGAFKCKPRDRWLGCPNDKLYKRLHLLGNNTRFLILGDPGLFPNVASFTLAKIVRRLSTDWEEAYGHPLLFAETFVDSERYTGHSYQAAGWSCVGKTKGYARAGGQYTMFHGKRKYIWLTPLRRDAHRLMRADTLPLFLDPNPMGTTTKRPVKDMHALLDHLHQMPDFRRAQGRKHSICSVLAIPILAKLSNFQGCLAEEQFARALSQKELQALGTWCNPKTGCYVPPSKATLHRVVAGADPAALAKVLKLMTTPKLQIGRALAADGKRLRGANRHSTDHYETVVMAEHGSGLPVGVLGYHDKGGERAAMHALFEQIPLRGRVMTIDALHTVRKTARLLVETHGAHYVMTVKENATATYDALSTIAWEEEATGSWHEDLDLAHGRMEKRCIDVMTPLEGMVNYPHVKQIFRITRWRHNMKTGDESTTVCFGMTSVSHKEASPQQVLEWNRGHWGVENLVHRTRDDLFKEDAGLARVGHAPTNRALCNTLALAVIIADGHSEFTKATRHYNLHRRDLFNAVLGTHSPYHQDIQEETVDIKP